MKSYISIVTLHVDDIDRAVDFYTRVLGWEKTMDVPMGDDRWVTVAPSGERTSFTLSKREANAPVEEGPQYSRVILEVDDVHAASAELQKAGVQFTDAPRSEPWGGWAMFKDSEGNIHGMHSPPAGR